MIHKIVYKHHRQAYLTEWKSLSDNSDTGVSCFSARATHRPAMPWASRNGSCVIKKQTLGYNTSLNSMYRKVNISIDINTKRVILQHEKTQQQLKTIQPGKD